MSKVQILIPSYNAEKTLGLTLESLLAQTYKNFEILVVDNCSTDQTRQIVSSFKDSRVNYVCNDSNLGNYGNFNRCMELAKYDYTAIFHADDFYLPTMLEEQVRIFDSDLEVGAVLTEALKVDHELRVFGHIRMPFWVRLFSKNGVVYFNFPSLLKAIIHYNCFLMCPSAMVRSNIYLDEIKRNRTELFGNAADVDVWLRIAKKWTVAVIAKSLMKYRISNTQHTYQINRNRIERSEYALIANYYRKTNKDILKYSDLAIKREKIIDLIVRLDSLKENPKKYSRYRKIILQSFFDFRLFASSRWWKYFLKFIR